MTEWVERFTFHVAGRAIRKLGFKPIGFKTYFWFYLAWEWILHWKHKWEWNEEDQLFAIKSYPP